MEQNQAYTNQFRYTVRSSIIATDTTATREDPTPENSTAGNPNTMHRLQKRSPAVAGIMFHLAKALQTNIRPTSTNPQNTTDQGDPDLKPNTTTLRPPGQLNFDNPMDNLEETREKDEKSILQILFGTRHNGQGEKDRHTPTSGLIQPILLAALCAGGLLCTACCGCYRLFKNRTYRRHRNNPDTHNQPAHILLHTIGNRPTHNQDHRSTNSILTQWSQDNQDRQT